MRAISDQEILENINNPQRMQLGYKQLVQCYSKRIYWQVRKLVITHEDADDVVQNVFIKIFKGIKNFKGDSKLSTWMYRIAYNESMTWLNKKARSMQITSEELVQKLTQNLTADVYFTEDEILIALQKALASLPDRQREIFNMRYYDSIKFSEIAHILELSEGAVKSSYHLAAKKVEQFIKTHQTIELD
ncbi:RNA polymerase sigma70 factor [Nonlabens sp. MIC269]|uniref:RNA polymerase sigma factor n=1 Tax=Nonlabens sp. MIC269 TaxID=1476901 RepID=UPI00071EF786|nr:RNA polymerase sigma factor [Nonlabens sp. MIC269]ALM21711.1 RNA polymerase sigma70 factor [Nonlabens sp. MIC269]